MKVQTKEELANYCLRRLGHPVIQVNVAAEQVSDRIDDALNYWINFHSDASYRAVYEHTLTQQEIDNGYIDIPDTIIQVYALMDGSSNPFGGIFSSGRMLIEDFYFSNTRFQLYDYNMLRTYINLVDQQMGTLNFIEFNRVLNRIFLLNGIESHEVGDKLVFEVEKMIDTSTSTGVFDDMWIKDYATALIKYQWGENLKKYQGMQLPGGVSLNPDLISSEAREEILRLKEEMDLRYAEPLGFLMG